MMALKHTYSELRFGVSSPATIWRPGDDEFARRIDEDEWFVSVESMLSLLKEAA
jgi:hypothetical protein